MSQVRNDIRTHDLRGERCLIWRLRDWSRDKDNHQQLMMTMQTQVRENTIQHVPVNFHLWQIHCDHSHWVVATNAIKIKHFDNKWHTNVFDWNAKLLVPLRIKILGDGSTFVNLLSISFEFYIWVTGTYKIEKMQTKLSHSVILMLNKLLHLLLVTKFTQYVFPQLLIGIIPFCAIWKRCASL